MEGAIPKLFQLLSEMASCAAALRIPYIKTKEPNPVCKNQPHTIIPFTNIYTWHIAVRPFSWQLPKLGSSIICVLYNNNLSNT